MGWKESLNATVVIKQEANLSYYFTTTTPRCTSAAWAINDEPNLSPNAAIDIAGGSTNTIPFGLNHLHAYPITQHEKKHVAPN